MVSPPVLWWPLLIPRSAVCLPAASCSGPHHGCRTHLGAPVSLHLLAGVSLSELTLVLKKWSRGKGQCIPHTFWSARVLEGSWTLCPRRPMKLSSSTAAQYVGKKSLERHAWHTTRIPVYMCWLAEWINADAVARVPEGQQEACFLFFGIPQVI